MTHGTRYAYRSIGCRCDECRGWEATRKRSQRDRHRRQAERDDAEAGWTGVITEN